MKSWNVVNNAPQQFRISQVKKHDLREKQYHPPEVFDNLFGRAFGPRVASRLKHPKWQSWTVPSRDGVLRLCIKIGSACTVPCLAMHAETMHQNWQRSFRQPFVGIITICSYEFMQLRSPDLN